MNDLILLIDDDESLLEVTEYNLSSAGFTVITAESGRAGLELFSREQPDLVITDVRLGDMSGLEIVREIKKRSPETQIIVFTAFGSIEMAVEAMKCGAFHFIPKPFDREALRLSCHKALEFKTLKRHNTGLVEEIERLTGDTGIKMASQVMNGLLETAMKVAESSASVLITGESGTGKDVLARLIHQNSSRCSGSMISVNCAAIPDTLMESELFGHVKGAFTGAVSDRKGKFAAANGGTLFLDEIAEMKTEMQAKLLRALQEMAVEPVGADKCVKTDFRLITATNKDIKSLVTQGLFREDLYYRISVIPLHIPPLRERRDDILLLARHFLKQFMATPDTVFSSEAESVLLEHTWPGNIRELRNTIERAVILGNGRQIDKKDLTLVSEPLQASAVRLPDGGIALEQVEKDLIQQALARANGNRSEAARLLRIPRHVLIYRLEKYQIQ